MRQEGHQVADGHHTPPVGVRRHGIRQPARARGRLRRDIVQVLGDAPEVGDHVARPQREAPAARKRGPGRQGIPDGADHPWVEGRGAAIERPGEGADVLAMAGASALSQPVVKQAAGQPDRQDETAPDEDPDGVMEQVPDRPARAQQQHGQEGA